MSGKIHYYRSVQTMIVDNILWSHTCPLELDRVEENPVSALPGLLVVQARHLSSVALLLTIQVGHSHDPSAGLNFWDSSDC